MVDVSELREQVAGRVITPDEADYDAARSLWNAMIDLRPAVIVRCHGTADVRLAVQFARTTGLEVAVRGGGHNVAGNASTEGGVVVDLSQMRSVIVDPNRRRAICEGGATLADYDRETQQFGLASPTGAISMTGVAGLTLGGGLGHLMRKYGLACDRLVGAQLVTADADVLNVDAASHPDLLWALRGGGGNFGIVTRFEFELDPVGPIIYGGLLAYPAQRAAEVFRAYRDVVESNDEIGLNLLFLTAPPLPFVPPEMQFTPIIGISVCWCDDPAMGESIIEPLRAIGPALDLVGPMPFVALQQMFDAGFGPGKRSYWKSGYLSRLDDATISSFIESATAIPSPFSIVECQPLGGAVARLASNSACGNRDAAYLYNVVAAWEEPSNDDAQVAWARDFHLNMSQHATGGVYVNYLTSDEAERVTEAYGDNRFRRLAHVKATYDPTNMFHRNQNIEPATTG